MGRKKHRSNGSPIRKYAKKAIGVVRIIVGVAGFGHGAISSAQRTILAGNPAAFPSGMIRDYTGVTPETGSFEQQQAIASGSIILGTIVILKLLSYGARHI
jgi:hypothetical protein